MKRCPQCEFIYPDRDSSCDFDQTPLVSATESEIAALTNTPEKSALSDLAATHPKKIELTKNRRALTFTGVLGLVLGLTAVAFYFSVHRRITSRPIESASSHVTNSQGTVSAPVSPSPSPSNSQSPELIASEERTQAASPRKSPAQSTRRFGAISSGPPRTDGMSNGKPVILLTTGGKIEADAAWRTKDGVWYRRNGIVTLLKGNLVRGIVGQ